MATSEALSGPPTPDVATLADAIRLHREGRTWEAELIYRRIVRDEPRNSAALHLLGVARHQRGDHAAAVELIGKAIALDPAKGVYFNNFGAALLPLGRPVEALACFHRALAIRPDYADAQANLGLALERLGQLDAARASY
jgi:Flp pilus assembly protein TadD